MPPPPPNFLPASRRRHLDPTRHLKSRELWNQVRFHATAHQHSNNSAAGNNPSSSENNTKWFTSLLHAIAYELQPFRIKPSLQRVKTFIIEEEGIQKITSTLLTHTKSIFSTIIQLLKLLHQQLKQINLHSLQSFTTTHKSLLTKTTSSIIILRLYYKLLVYIHELLHAGPLFLIATGMTLLYTIGLGDNTGAGSGIPSAYSVFNRGFQRIMGTVDGEELARQYAGGAAMMAMGGGGGAGNMNHHAHENQGNNNMNGFDDDEDDGFWVQDHEHNEEEEERNLVNERRRQRRLERLEQQRQRNGDAAAVVNNDTDGNDEQPHGNDDDDADLIEEDDSINEHDANNNNNNNANGTNNTGAAAAGRKSGKKARRRNLKLRREMQRQRQAAAAMGFGAGGDGGGVDNEMDARMAL